MKFLKKFFSVDWVSQLAYDINHDEENLLKEVNLFLDTIKIVEENDINRLFDESPKSEISQ
jgi:hypothetical protein